MWLLEVGWYRDRADIMTDRPELAYEVYRRMEMSSESLILLDYIANLAYKARHSYAPPPTRPPVPGIKLEFHDTDTDILADSPDTSTSLRGSSPREDVGVGVVEFQL